MRTSHGAQRNGRTPRRARLVALMTAALLGGGIVAGTPLAATAEGPTQPARTTAGQDGAGLTSLVTTLARPRWTAGAVPLG